MTVELTCAASTAPELLQVDDARIVEYIASGDSPQVCACHLPDALGISQPTLSHHMKKLVDAGILHRVQRGRWADYSIDRTVLDRLRGWPANCRD